MEWCLFWWLLVWDTYIVFGNATQTRGYIRILVMQRLLMTKNDEMHLCKTLCQTAWMIQNLQALSWDPCLIMTMFGCFCTSMWPQSNSQLWREDNGWEQNLRGQILYWDVGLGHWTGLNLIKPESTDFPLLKCFIPLCKCKPHFWNQCFRLDKSSHDSQTSSGLSTGYPQNCSRAVILRPKWNGLSQW